MSNVETGQEAGDPERDFVIDVRSSFIEPQLPPIPNPATWRRWLGRELVRLRNDAGMTQAAARKALGCSVGRMTYIEAGEKTPPTEAELTGVLLPLYGVPQRYWDLYVQAAFMSTGKGWWDAWAKEDVPPSFNQYLGLEDAAVAQRSFHPTYVYGLVHTAAYAAALLRHHYGAPIPEAKVERLVRLRLARQRRLQADTNPAQLHVVLDEAALHRVVGGPKVMAAQLDYLIELATTRDNVQIQVLSFADGPYRGVGTSYSILDLGMETDPGVVYSERGLHEALFLDSLHDLDVHAAAFEEASAIARDHNESLDLIRRLREDYARAGTN